MTKSSYILVIVLLLATSVGAISQELLQTAGNGNNFQSAKPYMMALPASKPLQFSRDYANLTAKKARTNMFVGVEATIGGIVFQLFALGIAPSNPQLGNTFTLFGSISLFTGGIFSIIGALQDNEALIHTLKEDGVDE